MYLLKNKKFKSEFFKIYLCLILILTLTSSVIIIIGSGIIYSTEADNFVVDAQFMVDEYLVSSKNDDHLNLRGQLIAKKKISFYIFEIEAISNKSGNYTCIDCRFIGEFDQIPVFLNSDGLYSAVFKLPYNINYILISENKRFFSPEINWYQDTERLTVLSLYLGIAISLGFIIYLQMRKLDQYLNSLRETCKEFGGGDINARANERVPHPISVLAQDFNQMACEIKEKINKSNIFTQAISHEIRTPLSRIQLTCDISRKSAPEDIKKTFDKIDNYINDLNSLISDIVTVAKLSESSSNSLQLTFEEIDINSFIKNRLENYWDFRFNIKIPDECSYINGDRILVQILVDNIISNAIKFASSQIDVSLNYSHKSITLTIDDDGPGVPQDKRNDVFVAFNKLDESRNTNKGGFGLGLTIAVNAAKAMGWTIQLSESPLGGARFCVFIPSQ